MMPTRSASMRAGLLLGWLSIESACLDELSVGSSRNVVSADAGEAADPAQLDSGAEPRDGGSGDAQLERSDADTSRDGSVVRANQRDAGHGPCAVSFCAIAGLKPDKASVCDDGGMAACLRDETGICAWHCR